MQKKFSGLIVTVFSCLLASQAFAFHSKMDLRLDERLDKTRAKLVPKTKGLAVVAVLVSADFDYVKWDYVTLTGPEGEVVKSLKCFMSMCVYAVRLEPGNYHLVQLWKSVTQGNMIYTTTAPLGDLGWFKVEVGKVTNLGVIGVAKKPDSDSGTVTGGLGRKSFEIVRYGAHMSAENTAYVNKAIKKDFPGFSTDGVLGWNPQSNFEKLNSIKDLMAVFFQDFSRVIPGGDGKIYFPTALGNVYTLDTSANFGRLDTGVNLHLHALYAERDFYLLGGDAGKLYLYKPGQEEAKIIGEFGQKDFVTDILKYDNQYYAIVLTDGYQAKAYRFSDPEAPVFEKPINISGVKGSLFDDFNVGYLKDYEIEQIDGGFFLKLNEDGLGYFDFKTGESQKVKFPGDVERFSALEDRSLVVVAGETKMSVAPESAAEDTGEAQIQDAPEAKKVKVKKPVKKGVSVLMQSRDWKKWDTLAKLNGDIVSNACFADLKTGYLVLRKNIFDRGRGQYDYLKSQLFKTADGGLTWEGVGEVGAISGDDFEISCRNGKLVLIGRDKPTVQVSKDGGKTWSQNSSIFDIVSDLGKAKEKKPAK